MDKKKTWHYIHCFISIAIMLGVKYIPAPAPMTQLGMEVLGIFAGMLYGWLVISELVWPSIFGLILLGLSDYSNVKTVFMNGFGNDTVLLVIFFMLFAGIMNHAGITDYIARKFVTLKIAKGRPYVLMLLLCLAMIAIEMFVSITAAVMIMYPLTFEICRLYDVKPGEKWVTLMCLGILWTGSMSFLILPFKTVPALVLRLYGDLSGGATIDYVPYFIVTITGTICVVATFLLFCRFIAKPDVTKLKQDLSIRGTEKLSNYQRFILGYFIVVLFLLMVPSVAPKTWTVTVLLNNIGNTGTLLLAIAVYLFFDFKEGMSVKQMFSDGVAWPVVFLLIDALSLGSAFEAEETGIIQFLSYILDPIFEGRSPIIFIALIVIVSAMLTNVTNNLACVAIFVPIAYTLGVTFGGVSMPALMIMVIMSCVVGIAFPPASSPAAILFGYADWCPAKLITKYGVTFVIFNCIIVCCIVYPLSILLF